jgi:predicted regulator of Ras-like GTPase activity (Roadblock/LC7/MglB family)
VAVSAVEAMLAPMKRIDGFVLACLVDADSGLVLGAVRGDDSISVPVAAAGAADVAGALSLMTSRLALKGDLEDVIVTLGSHYHLIRALPAEPAGQLVLLVTLERPAANLAMAHREVRESASAAAGRWFHAGPAGDDASGA